MTVRPLLTTFRAPMKLRPLAFSAASLFLALFLAATAVAQTTPTFTYAKPDEVKVAARAIEVVAQSVVSDRVQPPTKFKKDMLAQLKNKARELAGSTARPGGV